MRKSKWLLTVGLLIGVCFVSSAYAWSGHEGKKDKWMAELNLTEEQKEKLKPIREDFHEKKKGMRTEMREARKELQAAFKTDASEKSLRKKFKKLQALKNKMANSRIEKMFAIRRILTLEQREKLKAFHHGRKHKRGDGPGPERGPDKESNQ